MASRGKLTGKSLPVLEPALTSASQESQSPKSLTPAESSGSREERVDSSTLTETEPITVPHALRNAFRLFNNDDVVFNNPFAKNVDLSCHDLPEYLQDQTAQMLFHYYDHVVAALMPWVDGHDNDWRNLMLPLALKSPSLLLAILALSAEHYSTKMGPTLSDERGITSSHYRDRSVTVLAKNLRTELNEDSIVELQEPATAMLATILVLCNLEMIRSDSAVWRVHWKAARTITRRWTPHHPSRALDPTYRFLVKEAFVYDVFGSSTTFDTDGEISGSVLSDDDCGAFTEWLQVVQEVTIAERCRNDNSRRDECSQNLGDMRVLQDRFDRVRNSSLHHGRTMNFKSATLQADFNLLVDIFHFAGLLYSYQALLGHDDHAAARAACVSGVVNSIGQIQNMNAFQHDLVWPLFLIGAESRHHPETQKFAETKLIEAMDSTGFSTCYPALKFLQRFWATDPSVATNWVHFARQESKRGLNFLVI